MVLSNSCYLELSEEGLIKVRFPFDAVTHSQLKKIRPRGIWKGMNHGWEFPLIAIDALNDLLGNRFVLNEELADWSDILKKSFKDLPSHEILLKSAALDVELLDGRRPLPHQCSGVSWLLRRNCALLADEMGLGKTLTALLAARAIVRCSSAKVVVVAPVSLHVHWETEAKALGLDLFLESWSSLPRSLPFEQTILIIDEAHFAQSIKAKRTKSLLRLSRDPRLRAIWLLTGTPMKNAKPYQLLPLLEIINHPIVNNRGEFVKRFCKNSIVLHSNSCLVNEKVRNELKELKDIIAPFILYRDKKSLLDLPPKIRIRHKITLTPSQELGFQYRLALVISEYHSRIKKGLVSPDTESLVALGAIRQIGAEFKLPEAYRLIKELIDSGQSVVLFSSFIRPLKLLNVRLGGDLLTGRQSLKERQAAVNRFQGGQTSLLLTTYATGGFGLNLNRASNVFLLERPWTPGDLCQAEDRCHRLDSKHPLNSHWLHLGFVDQLIDGLVATKAEKIDVFLGNKNVSIERQSLSRMFRSCMQLA